MSRNRKEVGQFCHLLRPKASPAHLCASGESSVCGSGGGQATGRQQRRGRRRAHFYGAAGAGHAHSRRGKLCVFRSYLARAYLAEQIHSDIHRLPEAPAKAEWRVARRRSTDLDLAGRESAESLSSAPGGLIVGIGRAGLNDCRDDLFDLSKMHSKIIISRRTRRPAAPSCALPALKVLAGPRQFGERACQRLVGARCGPLMMPTGRVAFIIGLLMASRAL